MTDRWEVPDSDLFRQILSDPPAPPPPPGLRFSRPAQRTYFRDVYFDTPEGELGQRGGGGGGGGARCRVRFDSGGGCALTVTWPGGPSSGSRVRGAEPADLFAADSAPGRQLRALIDPTRLAPWIELEIERAWRPLCWRFVPLPLCDVVLDDVTARRGEFTARTHEVALRPRLWGGGGGRAAAARMAQALEARLPLRPAGGDRLQRAIAALDGAQGQALARELRGEREVALVAVEHGRLALRRAGADLRLPVQPGSGEAACRAALRDLVGSGEGQVRLIGVVPASGARPASEVWVARQLRRTADGALQWFTPGDLLARVGSPVLRDPGTLAALTVAARSPLVPEWSGGAFADSADGVEGDAARDAVARASRVTLSELRTAALPEAALDPTRLAPEQFLSAELSWLEFNARVLALAEDPRTPPVARVRFLSIFSTHLDQFVMTQLGALKQLVALGRAGPSADGLRPQETLDAVAVRLRPLLARQGRAFRALSGLGIVRWAELNAEEQARMRKWAVEELLPFLTPKALTRAPGHPFPLVGDRRIALLVALRDHPGGGGPVHYAHVEVPEVLPRLIAVEAGRRFLPVEDLVRATLDLLFPDREVAAAHAFRITRSGDLQLDEASTANFLQSIEEELARRQQRPVVRIEIEAGTPPALQQLLQRELRFEESERESTLSPADVYEADGLLDLGRLGEIAASLPVPDYPPFTPREPFAPGRPVAEQLDEHDVLVHHPYDSFPGSFERFVTEAAADPEVAAIKLTLYRPGGGGPSAIANALRQAAASGKDVSVLVELKARFDEARNIEWARGLERDGIHVVTGLVSLKTHAKLALVVGRRTGGRVRRYAHIGTGNYNPDTARVYTDLGLFTADPRITNDVHALFNDLTGSSRAPRARLRHLLVAPAELLDRLLALIERESAHARAGRAARIRAKLNGLADVTVIQALYRASQAGVDVDLVVRGICTLRPGVPGLSERIRVVSILGRFLEHARIYHFGNGGSDEYYIGSADWRPRNLRRRVEVVAPVFDTAARAQLDRILETELTHPAAWLLTPDGSYEQGVS